MERKVALFFNELREETGPSGQQGARGVGRGACGGAASSPGGVGTLISQGYICFQMKTRRAGVGQSTSVWGARLPPSSRWGTATVIRARWAVSGTGMRGHSI
ncbi:hypothetical protein L1887_61418 [Cichorium endivia]|nr:hypothetical protein L1887_61418 [Cichorium endivia]